MVVSERTFPSVMAVMQTLEQKNWRFFFFVNMFELAPWFWAKFHNLWTYIYIHTSLCIQRYIYTLDTQWCIDMYVCMYYWVHKDVSSSATSCDLPSIFYDSACDYVNYRHYADKTSHFSFIKSSWNPYWAYKNFKTLGLSHTDIHVHCHTHAHSLWSTV